MYEGKVGAQRGGCTQTRNSTMRWRSLCLQCLLWGHIVAHGCVAYINAFSSFRLKCIYTVCGGENETPITLSGLLYFSIPTRILKLLSYLNEHVYTHASCPIMIGQLVCDYYMILGFLECHVNATDCCFSSVLFFFSLLSSPPHPVSYRKCPKDLPNRAERERQPGSFQGHCPSTDSCKFNCAGMMTC